MKDGKCQAVVWLHVGDSLRIHSLAKQGLTLCGQALLAPLQQPPQRPAASAGPAFGQAKGLCHLVRARHFYHLSLPIRRAPATGCRRKRHRTLSPLLSQSRFSPSLQLRHQPLLPTGSAAAGQDQGPHQPFPCCVFSLAFGVDVCSFSNLARNNSGTGLVLQEAAGQTPDLSTSR